MCRRLQNSLPTIALLCAALLGCSSAGTQPDWVDRPDSKFSAATHLTAVGSATDRQTAADRATSNLAKIFEVAVDEATLDFSRAQMQSGESGQVTINEQQVTRTISTQARQVLEGVEIAEYWAAPDGRTYALAVLARQPAATRFRNAITAQDREIAGLLDYAGTAAANPVAGLNALVRAREVQRLRDQNNKNLMVVADGKGVSSRYSLAQIDAVIRDALGALQVQVRTDDAQLQTELEQALSRLGVQAVAQSNLVLTGMLDMAPIEEKQGWYWLRGSYDISFLDGDIVLSRERWEIKVSSTDAAVLEKRVQDEVNTHLPRYVFQLLSNESPAG